MLSKRLAQAVLALCVLTPLTCSATSYSGLYVFGDSLSDDGSDFALSSALNAVSGGAFPLVPAPAVSPYHTFGNGPVAVDYLASSLGLPLSAHYLTPGFLGGATGGNNYAQGGATSGTINASLPGTLNLGPTTVSTGFTGINGEIADYAAVHPVADPNALYVVWSGANDFLHLGAVPAAPGCVGSTVAVAVCTAISNIATSITTLASMGAQHILVPNLPDLGETPSAIVGGPAAIAAAHALSVAFNNGLAVALSGLSSLYPGDIIPFDLNGLFSEVLANASSYGFTDTTDTCLTGSVADPTSTVSAACAAAGADHYIFWDDVHPTTVVQALIGERLFAAVVPEPSEVALLGLGMIALVGVRRRSPSRRPLMA